ncbi:hypothetical protein 2F1_7 [Uncultured Caudovirales phage clone 2F_1]|uniref:Uncharacterized protein n=1 Tax=Uncultured Caudovirales phage clone 2F_1 TaxID=2992576 RepID=A0A2H4JFV4_9CAUD|nr:hypothetical protein KNT73_gp07 [Uncultured Caudovirales phage clone 2F_1]ASN71608.1 hypothetical protein 2F1_7 [Uncultured Caudovirales phage clone 2F_1]
MPNSAIQQQLQIKNSFFCCPNCEQPLTVLGTIVVSKEEPRAYVGECRELTCMTLVHFHIQLSNVIAPSRLINISRNIER